MYAIIKDGAHQRNVTEGQVLEVAYRKDAAPGDTLEFDQITLLNKDGDIRLGTPIVSGVKVLAEVLNHKKAKKIIVFKFRRRKSSKSKKGHRQKFTRVRISSIEA